MNIHRAAFGRTRAPGNPSPNHQGALALQGLDFPLDLAWKTRSPSHPWSGLFFLNDPGRLHVKQPNQQRVNGTGMKRRQFIRKAIRPCSRVAFSIRSMRKTKWKKLLGGDGVEIVVFTISAWALLFVVYILGFVFRLWWPGTGPLSRHVGLARFIRHVWKRRRGAREPRRSLREPAASTAPAMHGRGLLHC
jgi:hypothetical protein